MRKKVDTNIIRLAKNKRKASNKFKGYPKGIVRPFGVNTKSRKKGVKSFSVKSNVMNQINQKNQLHAYYNKYFFGSNYQLQDIFCCVGDPLGGCCQNLCCAMHEPGKGCCSKSRPKPSK